MKSWAILALAVPTMALGQLIDSGAGSQPQQQVPVSGSYKVSGDKAIRPSLLWDDGGKTFLDWPENIEAPAIFTIDAGGNESLVNCYYRGGHFVIDAVHSRLLFRLDRLTARADRRVGG